MLIHIQHLYKLDGSRRLLDDVSLDVPASSVFGIFGRNGSGKSTLLRCITGLERPSRGSIELEQKVRHSFALQSHGLAAELTVGENLQLFASLAKIPAKRRTNRVAQVIQSLDLTREKSIRIDRLSPGVVSRVEIARAMVADTNLVLIDGLLDDLDRSGSERVWQAVLARRRNEGTAFVIATTRAEIADRCDILAVLHKGRVAATGTPSKLKSAMESDAFLIDAIRNPLIKSKIKERFAVSVEQSDGMLKIKSAEKVTTVMDLLADYGSDVGTVYLKQPNLDDLLEDIAKGQSDNA